MPTPDQSSSSHPDLSPKLAGKENDQEPTPLRIATRESPLALWQARHVADLLAKDGVATSIVPLVSSGDVDMRPIDGKRSVGVFTKRIQQALLQDEGDIAVHSMKDLPTEPHPELIMVASPQRETVADCLVSPGGVELDSLPSGARIGTGSRRRAAQLLRYRDDLKILPIRGNVQTRLKKMHEGEFDAIVLAAAGIERLEMNDLPRYEFPLELMLPAPGQGALAIEVRSNDAGAIDAVSALNVPHSAACTLAERTLLSALHGGCLAPIAAYAQVQSSVPEAPARLLLDARVLSIDGKQCLQASAEQEISLDSSQWASTAIELGKRVSDELIDQGAKALIESGR